METKELKSGESDLFVKFNRLVKLANKTEGEKQ